MRNAPKWTDFYRYPVVAGTALLATAVTLAWWGQADVSRLFENAMVRRGELWRLATSMLPHVGLMHLAFNLYWLWVFGTLVEEVYSHAKMAALVLLLGIASGAFEYGFLTGGVGLSGVGYGLFGLLWVLSRRDPRFHDAIDSRTIGLFVIWFFLCIALTASGVMPVGNIAHGTGAVLGALVGLAITQPERRVLLCSAAVLMVAFGLWAATLGRPVVNLSRYGAYEECAWGYDALDAGRYQEAQRWLAQAVRYRYADVACWVDLASAENHLGNSAVALAHYRRAAEMGEKNAQYYLGTLYESGDGTPKDKQKAMLWYRKAADQGLPEALNDVAWEYATSTDPAFRNPQAALRYATQAVAAEKDNPMYLDTLAEAQYANGKYEDAVKTEQKAIGLSKPTADERPDMVKNLAKYVLAVHSGKRVAALKRK
jgi:membrane associated rhomboid family serine protease